VAQAPYEVRDGAAWIVLDRPNVKNAVDFETLQALRSAAVAAETDDNVRRVVLTGTGDVFSSGGDVNDMVRRRGRSAATFERHLGGLADLVERIASSDKVWLARVNGDAVGAGLGLVLSCDLAVATETARFSAAFGRLGLVADSGVSHYLVRYAGLRRAQELLLTGRFLSAHEAVEWGLINAAVPATGLDAAVTKLAEGLETVPAPTLGRLKRQVRRNGTVGLRDALRHEAMLQGLAFATPEHAQRSEAFLRRKEARRK
jgi:2-(1,2-epoxy-1,2-dihydrophenyl)acetyl-CoA isomerase